MRSFTVQLINSTQSQSKRVQCNAVATGNILHCLSNRFKSRSKRVQWNVVATGVRYPCSALSNIIQCQSQRMKWNTVATGVLYHCSALRHNQMPKARISKQKTNTRTSIIPEYQIQELQTKPHTRFIPESRIQRTAHKNAYSCHARTSNPKNRIPKLILFSGDLSSPRISIREQNIITIHNTFSAHARYVPSLWGSNP